nr:MAG TPA: Scaffold protein [Microviridae sp.]
MRFKTIFDTYEEKQGIIFKEPTMTVQSEKDNCDINVIMNRYATCGTPLPYRTDGVQPVYADVSELGDYMENYQRCKQAEEMFNSLPSALRKELDNNPANLIPFIQDEKNKERCYEYGLLNRPVVEAPQVTVVAPSVPASVPAVDVPDSSNN